VLEAEGDGDAGRTAAAVPSPARAVPASLHASLMARLDRLGSAKEGQAGSETKSLYPVGTADEQQVGLPDLGGDQNDSLASADDLIESLRSGSSWSQGIRVDQEDRERVINSAVFQDSLAIRAGLIVVVMIALVGLAWIVRSSISPGRLPSGPLVLTANSSPTIPEDKGDRIQPPGMRFVRALVMSARRRIQNVIHQRATVRSRRLERLVQQAH